MRLLVVMVATAALASSALAQDSTPFDFGRFHFGMTPAEFGRVAPGPSWQTRHFGDDLIVVGSSDPISIGLQDFWPAFGFRNGHLTKIVFETVAQVAAHSDCAARLQPVLGELETTVGVFNGPPEPDEFGPLQSTQSTPNGSEVRTYNYDADGVAISAANYSGAFFASVNAFPFRQASGEIRCDLTIHLRPSGPPPALDMAAPTNTELAAATEIEPDWVKQPDSDAYEMSVPPIATLDGVSGIATLDCLVCGRRPCELPGYRRAAQRQTLWRRGLGAVALLSGAKYRGWRPNIGQTRRNLPAVRRWGAGARLEERHNVCSGEIRTSHGGPQNRRIDQNLSYTSGTHVHWPRPDTELRNFETSGR